MEFDDAQAIGRRYRRQDEIGTPYCVTVDFDTLTDNAVTIRDRDTMAQERISIDAVERYLLDRLPPAAVTRRWPRRPVPGNVQVAGVAGVLLEHVREIQASDGA